MGTARDIALIFLSLDALVIALVPLVLFVGLAYGVFRLHRLAKVYLQKAQVYAQQAYDYVERASETVTRPLIRVSAAGSQMTAIVKKLTGR